jgi:hypothetical protein
MIPSDGKEQLDVHLLVESFLEPPCLPFLSRPNHKRIEKYVKDQLSFVRA